LQLGPGRYLVTAKAVVHVTNGASRFACDLRATDAKSVVFKHTLDTSSVTLIPVQAFAGITGDATLTLSGSLNAVGDVRVTVPCSVFGDLDGSSVTNAVIQVIQVDTLVPLPAPIPP